MVGGAGATGALGLLLAACGGDDKPDRAASGTAGMGAATTRDRAAANRSDLATVNYALRLEYHEADSYDQAVRSGELKDRAVADLARRIGEAERLLLAALQATVRTLGGKPAAKPAAGFDDVLSGGASRILETAAVVENLGAAAYLGQAPRTRSEEVLAAALSIHSVAARHAAALNKLVGRGFRGARRSRARSPTARSRRRCPSTRSWPRSSRSSRPDPDDQQETDDHGRAAAREMGGDLDVLNFALTLEYLEATFYSRTAGKGRHLSGETMRLVARDPRQRDRARRRAHRDHQAPRRHARPGAEGRLRRRVHDQDRFLDLAQTLEDTGVSAHNGAAPSIPVERRPHGGGLDRAGQGAHAALIRLMRGVAQAPDAYDPVLDQNQVLSAVKPFMRM
jgi:ferritin-like protein